MTAGKSEEIPNTSLSLEQALEKLEAYSRAIQNSEQDFESSLKIYEQAKALSSVIEKKLASYKKKLEFFDAETNQNLEE